MNTFAMAISRYGLCIVSELEHSLGLGRDSVEVCPINIPEHGCVEPLWKF